MRLRQPMVIKLLLKEKPSPYPIFFLKILQMKFLFLHSLQGVLHPRSFLGCENFWSYRWLILFSDTIKYQAFKSLLHSFFSFAFFSLKCFSDTHSEGLPVCSLTSAQIRIPKRQSALRCRQKRRLQGPECRPDRASCPRGKSGLGVTGCGDSHGHGRGGDRPSGSDADVVPCDLSWSNSTFSSEHPVHCYCQGGLCTDGRLPCLLVGVNPPRAPGASSPPTQWFQADNWGRPLTPAPCWALAWVFLCRVLISFSLSLFFFFLFFSFFLLFRAAPAAHRGSQARGRIRATAASLHHSHSNEGSEPSLQPTPQLTATLDP